MAKGNDGHYLQHSVELAVAVQLAALGGDGRLHMILTHGMAPFEACDDLPNRQEKKLFNAALRNAEKRPVLGEPKFVTAYRATGASRQHYPNSAELIASIIGRDQLSGEITETCPEKCKKLQDAWSGSAVHIIASSWRRKSVHRSPFPSSPWLFSMDPMTYTEKGYADDDKIYRFDRKRIVETLSCLIHSDAPGIAAIFVYAVQKKHRPSFWGFVKDIADDTGMFLEACWLPHLGGNRNLAAIFSSCIKLPPKWLPASLRPGRYDASEA